MLWELPPIHFGKEDGVECTLLRVACQSETFLASPWQGGADIRLLWHIGCQSEFAEFFRRSLETSSHPVRSLFGRMKAQWALSPP